MISASCAARWPRARSHTKFELGGIQNNSDWILPLGACLVILLFVRAMYRRDAAELPRLWGWFLTLLRAATFLGLLFLFLQPQWRTELEVTHNSRVALLVDTSLSMGLNDSDSDAACRPARPAASSKWLPALAETELLPQLRKTHDVAVYKFNNSLDRDLVSLDKLPPRPEAAAEGGRPRGPPARRRKWRPRPAGGRRAAATEWRKFLTPAGTETRLGEALQQLLHQERGTPLAGVVLLSDGGQNAGAGPEGAIELAREAKVPIFTVGLGSDKKPPERPRQRPGGAGAGLSGRPLPRDRLPPGPAAGRQSGDGAIALPRVGPRRRPLAPRHRAGRGEPAGHPRRRRRNHPGALRVDPEEGRGRPADPLLPHPDPCRGSATPPTRSARPTSRSSTTRTACCCWPAGRCASTSSCGPCCTATAPTTVDVLLQTAQQGVSQEANKILSEFPSTPRGDVRSTIAWWPSIPNWQALTPVEIERAARLGGRPGGRADRRGRAGVCRQGDR